MSVKLRLDLVRIIVAVAKQSPGKPYHNLLLVLMALFCASRAKWVELCPRISLIN